MKKPVAVASLAASLLVVPFLIGSAALAQDSSPVPPKDLKLVGDHWTPWDPPEAGPGAYIIVRGDTLWHLAERWLGDPFLWPQIWDENRYILDSHWIYPGDPLVIPGRPVVVPDEGPPPVVEVPVELPDDPGSGGEEVAVVPEPVPVPVPEPEPVPEPVRAKPLVPAATPSDLYCSGYIDPEHRYSEIWVTGQEEPHREQIGQGDVIYLSQGRAAGLASGDEFAVVRKTRPVVHPESRQPLGDFIRRLGKVRVMLAQEHSSTAVVQFACEDIRGSDELVPWRDIPVPMFSELPPFDRHDPHPTGGTHGRIVSLPENNYWVGEGQIVQTDLGAAAGVAPGQFLLLYRDRRELPRLMIGQAVILTVEPLTSSAMIRLTVREGTVGDSVEVIR